MQKSKISIFPERTNKFVIENREHLVDMYLKAVEGVNSVQFEGCILASSQTVPLFVSA